MDSKVIQLYKDIYSFHILFYYGLAQDIKYNSLLKLNLIILQLQC